MGYIQLNPPVVRHWLVFDIDIQGASSAWELANLAPPNWIAVNRRNGHAHYGYLLEIPLITAPKGRDSPLKFAAAVESAYTLNLHADPGYSGFIAKNPLHDAWRTWYLHDHAYSLEELAEWTTLRPKSSAVLRTEGLGRNVQLFDSLREWAYGMVLTYKTAAASSEMWLRAVFQQAQGLNKKFENPLPDNEVRALVKSVANWTWKKFNAARFSEIQRERAHIRWAADGQESAESRKPWEAMGISRRMYYYRKNQGKLGL